MSVNVKLIAYTPNPEQTVAAAAKLCYSPASIDTVLDGLDEEKSRSFVKMLSSLGHTSTRLNPSLCPIPVESPHLSSLKGIRAHAGATIRDERGVIYSDSGEVQFGDKALSGIVMFQLSSAAANLRSDTLCVELDMLPERSGDEIVSLLTRRRTLLPHLTLENYLTGVFNKRVGMCILKQAGMTPLSRSVSELTDDDIGRIASVIKCWRFPVSGKSQWNSAQVTSGGIRLAEFDGLTMQSRLCKGIFASGESSGILAGRSAAERIRRESSSEKEF